MFITYNLICLILTQLFHGNVLFLHLNINLLKNLFNDVINYYIKVSCMYLVL